jgi:hypothetical protein
MEGTKSGHSEAMCQNTSGTYVFDFTVFLYRKEDSKKSA